MKTPQNILDNIKRWKAKNREKVLESQRKYREVHKLEILEKEKKRRENNPEKVKESKKKYREKNKEILLEKGRIYRETHTEQSHQYYLSVKERDADKRRANVRNRRARRNYIEGKITAAEWEELKVKYGNKCLCCKREDVKLELDHVIPLALGGEHNINNAQPLCRKCNASKNKKIKDYRNEYN